MTHNVQNLVRPVPQEVSVEVMQLREDLLNNEITINEYNRRMRELLMSPAAVTEGKA